MARTRKPKQPKPAAGGRPLRSDSVSHRRITVRFSPLEVAQLERDCAAQSCSLSDLIRARVVGATGAKTAV